jgi:anti-anti-sigma factor
MEEKNIIIDMTELIYISSAGLRVVLGYVKNGMKLGKKITVTGVSQPIREIFDVTGFSSILYIEK